MRLVTSLAIGLLVTSVTVARAKGEDDEESSDDEESTDSSDESSEDEGGEEDPDAGKVKEKPSKKAGSQQDADFKKQDLTGHAMGTDKKSNEFEKDRFFVDKSDTAKTEKGTLVQGSIASSSFLYTESGGAYAGTGLGSNAGKFSRYFTDLRLQTDFRHIGASRWDARVDARARFVNTPDDKTNAPSSSDINRVQSGFNGTNEYEIRELWIVRNGKRSDVILGRQFIPDLGAVKIDGLRIDYASSRTLTFLGFAGLYPIRGSRSITTDYLPLKDSTDQKNAAGRLVGAGGFGAAYRTLNTYGSLGGVALVPTAAEQPRFYVTSNGYYRAGPTLDVYHFGLFDLVGAGGFRITNLSAGLNFKPNQRLRLTGAFNRVDTDTLNVQANAFLDPAAGNTVIQNETFIQRLSTNQARAGVSAGLGAQQRFELSTAFTFRYRPDVTITAPGGMNPTTLPAAKGFDLYASLTDRRSIKDARIGVDGSRSFGIGAVPYQRTEVLALRLFVARELASGRGEWEAEVSYATTKDIGAGATCDQISTCFGSTANTIISGAGNFYYRINRNWFALISASLARQATQVLQNGMTITDPGIIGFTGYGRIAYRF